MVTTSGTTKPNIISNIFSQEPLAMESSNYCWYSYIRCHVYVSKFCPASTIQNRQTQRQTKYIPSQESELGHLFNVVNFFASTVRASTFCVILYNARRSGSSSVRQFAFLYVPWPISQTDRHFYIATHCKSSTFDG